MTLSLEKIAELIGATLIGDSDAEINGISTLTNANRNQISYVVSEKYIHSLTNFLPSKFLNDEQAIKKIIKMVVYIMMLILQISDFGI